MSKSKKILNLVTAVLIGVLIVCTVLSVIIRNQTQPLAETVTPTEEYIETGDGGMYIYEIPADALSEESCVYVLRSGIGLFGSVYHAEQVEVTLYERNGDTVTVTSNRLHRHDEVIVHPVERMSDGCTVRVEQPE